jgi:hypothetical protein
MASAALLLILIVVGPLALGSICGSLLGRTSIGIVAALALGIALTLGGLAIWYLDAPTDPTECLDCSEYWGRWMDETMFTRWLPLTLALWTLGVFFGARRRARNSTREANPD